VKKAVFILVFAQIFANSQIAPKYINSIFTQKSGIDIFFYDSKAGVSTFLQKHNLVAALYSDEIKVGLANQLGVFFAGDSYEIEAIDNNSEASKMGLKVGDKIVNFGGISLSSSPLPPLHEDPLLDKSPSFMLTIKRQGDTLEFGGGIKDLPLREWSDGIIKKYYQPQEK